MKMHAISTGSVQITRNRRMGKGEGLHRMANTFFDPELTEWLPIFCYILEHPEGLIVMDTGIPANANDPVFFPPWKVMQPAVMVLVQEDDHMVMLAGDASYSQDLLLAGAADGIGPAPTAQHETHRRILQFAARTPTVFLPAHEWNAEQRLAGRIHLMEGMHV